MSHYTTEDVQKVIDMTKRLLRLGKGLSAITPTTLDDDIISTIETVVLQLEPFAQDQLVVDLLNFVVGLLKSKDPKVVLEQAKVLLKEAN